MVARGSGPSARAQPPSPPQANQDARALRVRRIVSPRSGPVDTSPTSTPASSLSLSTYRRAFSGSAVHSLTPTVGVLQPARGSKTGSPASGPDAAAGRPRG